MIILGIDPGSRKAGYGVIKIEKRKFQYIASGVMSYDGVSNFMDRLGIIYESCLELTQEFEPDQIAIESLIYVKSVPSLAKLSQARGAMIAAFMATHQKKVFEYSPNLIKSSVSGHGHAKKEEIEKSISMILGKGIEIKRHDESDALAIAICHGLLEGSSPAKSVGRSGSSLRQAFKHLEKS
jgi:crossover junction endodeoxyribonuclease RuvC